jgi:CheY-like chemotaxis protein
MRILVADDSSITQKLMQHILKAAGYEVDVAESGHDVLSALEGAAYDVVLMDINMPKLDGLSTVKAIREKGDADTTPILVGMSAESDPERHREFLDGGFDHFFQKPLNTNDLRTYLADLDS